MDTVIDTNIFVHAKDMDKDYGMNCLMFLSNFLQCTDKMALDYQDVIMREYRDNRIEGDSFLQKFFIEMHRQNRFTFGDSSISKKQRDKLIQLSFHEPEDHVFVGVALSTDKTIVTDDSDYGVHGETDKQQVYEYMRDELQLTVFNSEQAKEKYLPGHID